jgi:hypothetical protein
MNAAAPKKFYPGAKFFRRHFLAQSRPLRRNAPGIGIHGPAPPTPERALAVASFDKLRSNRCSIGRRMTVPG